MLANCLCVRSVGAYSAGGGKEPYGYASGRMQNSANASATDGAFTSSFANGEINGFGFGRTPNKTIAK